MLQYPFEITVGDKDITVSSKDQLESIKYDLDQASAVIQFQIEDEE